MWKGNEMPDVPPDPLSQPLPEVHPDVAALAHLLGTWTGQGRGSYPTIESFEYHETITFGHVGKPFLSYSQRTTLLDTGAPSHAEVGYLRSNGTAAVELILAHPTGITELAEGTIDGATITLRSISVVGSSTAKPIRAIERDFTIEGDHLHYVLRMSAVGLPMTHHLEADLVRS